jgi:hypothetical protein
MMDEIHLGMKQRELERQAIDKTYKRKLEIRPEPTKRQYASRQLEFQEWSN